MNHGYNRLRAALDDAVKRGSLSGDFPTYYVGALLCDYDVALQQIERLRGLLREVRRAIPTGVLRITAADDGRLPERIDAALTGAADQPDAGRAYYETHEPPHCPTCGCGADNSPGITE